MTNFAVLPPEINSLCMFVGAGSAPMIEAATAWDGLATELGLRPRRFRRHGGARDALFPVWRYHPFLTDTDLPVDAADITHRQHAIIERRQHAHNGLAQHAERGRLPSRIAPIPMTPSSSS